MGKQDSLGIIARTQSEYNAKYYEMKRETILRKRREKYWNDTEYRQMVVDRQAAYHERKRGDVRRTKDKEAENQRGLCLSDQNNTWNGDYDEGEEAECAGICNGDCRNRRTVWPDDSD